MIIRGNTVGLPNPVPDWAQTTSSFANYIKNKPNVYLDVDGYTVVAGQRGISSLQIQESSSGPWTITITYAGGITDSITITPDASGNPRSISAGGATIPISYSAVVD